MASRQRGILAVVAGAVLWAVLWVGGTAAAGAALGLVAGEPVTDAATLLGYIAYSVVLSLLAGYVTTAIAGGADAMTPVWWLAGVQLLLVPSIVLGGRLRARPRALGRALA